jgi:hypothetical protein
MARKPSKKTRKYHKQNKIDYLSNQHKEAKKGTYLKCRLKTCRAKKYQSVYGASHGGSIRSANPVFL